MAIFDRSSRPWLRWLWPIEVGIRQLLSVEAMMGDIRFLRIFALLIVPVLVMFVLVTPKDTWLDLKFIFDRRIIRRAMRFRLPRRRKTSRWRFSIRSMLIVTTLLALQQGLLLCFQGQEWWAVLILTTFAAIVYLFVAVVTACRIPRRQYRKRYQGSDSADASVMPNIVTGDGTEDFGSDGAAVKALQRVMNQDRVK